MSDRISELEARVLELEKFVEHAKLVDRVNMAAAVREGERVLNLDVEPLKRLKRLGD